MRKRRGRGSEGVTSLVRSRLSQQGMCRGPIFPMVRANPPAGQTECERRIPMRSHVRRLGATLVAIFIFAGAALIASCAKPYHEETERYVFVATNINLPYWKEAEAGFLDAA